MATNATTPTPTPEPGKDAAPRPLSRLWQLPFFLACLAGFLYVYQERPLLHSDPGRSAYDRELAAIRALLMRSPAESGTALQAAQRAYDQVATQPQRAGEAAFLLGSAHLRRAETVTDPTKAREHLAQARRHLERASTQPLPDSDAPRLQYRLAKCLFLLEDAPERVVALLTGVVEKADDPAEGYQMLARAHLRLPKPDLRAALDANERLRQVPLAGEEVLAQARLDAGELLLKLKQPDDARKVLQKLLAKVGAPVPLPIQARARWLCAESFQEERRFGEAATLWVQAEADTSEPTKRLGRIQFNLGLCYRNNDQTADAVRAWGRCLQSGNGPEQQAAAVLLAELQVQDNAGDKALESLDVALRNVSKPADWTNDLVEVGKVIDLSEKAIPALAKGQPDLAVRWTQFYQRVAPPGRAEQLRGDLLAQLGKDGLANLAMASPADAPMAKEKATRQLREAAQTYATAAGLLAEPATKADMLWSSANLAIQVEDGEKATEWLIALIQHLDANRGVPDQPPPIAGWLERNGQAWFLLAETLRKADSPKAEEAYRNCVMAGPPYSHRARYQLAMYALNRGEIDDAEAELRRNLHWLRMYSDADKEAQERSLFALGGIYYHQKKYHEVVRTLEEALGRFPANPEATRAHVQLAQSYRQLSAQKNLNAQLNVYKSDSARKHFDQERVRWLEKAADEFTAVTAFLETPESAGHLTPEERIGIPFTVAECRFDLGQYKEAQAIYDHLAERHKGSEDGLGALAGAARCLAALGQGEQVRVRLNEIRAQLANVNETTRGTWEDWLIRASKPLSEPAQPNPSSNKPMGATQPLGPERINPNTTALPPG